MAEFKLAEVLPVLNQRCAMGPFPKTFHPRVTGKFYFCCKRAFLTDESFLRHRSLGGCKNNGDSVKDARKSDDHEQALETGSNVPSDPSTVRCQDVDDSLFSLEKLTLHNGTITNEAESENSTNSTLLTHRRKTGNLIDSNPQTFPKSNCKDGSTMVSNSLSSEYPNVTLLSLFGTSINEEETLLQCPKCTYSSDKVAVLIRHIESSHKAVLENGTINKESTRSDVQGKSKSSDNGTQKNLKPKIIRCDLCSNYTGSSRWSLGHHKKIAHVENGRFNCFLCDRVYGTHKGLKVHLSVLHKVSDSLQKSSPYINGRTKTTNTTGELDDRNRVERSKVDGHSADPIPTLEIKGNTSAKKAKFSCDLCPYATANICYLKTHKGKAHNPEAKYPCSYCSCRYNDISTLRGHISSMHKKASSPSTSLQFGTSNKNSLVANWLESIRCNERDYGTQDESLSLQYNIEGSSNRYQCKSCPQGFSSKTQLVSHYRQKHMYKSSNTTRTKIKQFSGMQMLLNKNIVTCLICKRNFSNAQQLANHELACHVKGGSYPCTVNGCKCVFGRKQSLATHLKRWHRKNKKGIIVAPSSILTPQLENGNSVLKECSGTVRGALASGLNNIIGNPDPESHITCSICRLVVNNHEELHSHRRNVHLLREVECICGCSFVTATELTKHKKYDCRESKKENQSQSSPHEKAAHPLRSERGSLSRNLRSSDYHLSNQEKVETTDCSNEVGTVTATTEITTTDRTMFPPKDFDKRPSMQCSKCSRTFYNEKGLQCHFVKMHLVSTYRACEICQYRTPNLRCYKYHKKTCHVINGIRCPNCQCSFKSIEGLSIHVKIMHKTKLDRSLLEVNCNQCTFITYLQAELDNHVQRIHVEGTPGSENEIKIKLQCPSCDFTTFGLQSLDAHQKSNHVENGVACMFCNNTFNTVGALNGHRRIHKKELTKSEHTICELCHYQTGSLKNFQQHNQRCHVKNGVSCRDCPCSFKDVYGLSQHMRMMHKKTVNKQDYMLRCPTCEFRTFSEGDLRRHVKFSHVKTEHNKHKELLKCNICDITITDSLESHIMRSHVEGGHACSDCKCSFKNERGLSKHLYIRHGKRVIVEKVRDPAEYTIKCNNCDFRCKTKFGLHQHSIKTHGVAIPYTKVLKVRGASRKVCNLCTMEFTGTLSFHNKNCHVENGFRCTHCCCTFETFKHRARHMCRIHKIVSMKQCAICELKYFGTFDHHAKRCHVENGVKCKYCTCTFESEYGMMMHSRKRHAHFSQVSRKETFCHLCEARITVKLESHLERCHVQNGYRCTGCSCSFETEVSRLRHMWRMHGLKIPLLPKKCHKCGIVPLQSMSYHLKHSHAENGLNCSQCNSSFDTERRRCRHMKKYHNVKLNIPPRVCEICNYVYSVPYHEHLKKNHVRNGYTCFHCKCSFRTKLGRKCHVLRKHKDAPKVNEPIEHRLKNACPLCGLELSESLEKHQKRNHSLAHQFKCAHCNCRFKTTSGRRCHVAAFHKTRKSLTGARPTTDRTGEDINRNDSVDNLFGCNNCSRSFRTESERVTHTKLSHGCLTGSSSLGDSLSAETQEIDNGSCKSTTAAKKSDGDGSSTKDISICLKCGFQASCLSRFKMHLQKSHVKNSPFPCKLCSCGYATEQELGRHVKIYHPDSA